MKQFQKKSQNVKWETTLDKEKVSHKLIRRVSIDQFYANGYRTTGCVFPNVYGITKSNSNVVENEGNKLIPNDTVINELISIASKNKIENKDLSIAMAVYLLGFSDYNGFNKN